MNMANIGNIKYVAFTCTYMTILILFIEAQNRGNSNKQNSSIKSIGKRDREDWGKEKTKDRMRSKKKAWED